MFYYGKILPYTPVPPTIAINTTSPLQGGGDLSVSRTLSILDAKADGTTKGAATFKASDFDDNGAGLISIDYTNGQAAGAAAKGFLTSTDWNTFNNKVDSVTAGSNISLGGTAKAPIINVVNVVKALTTNTGTYSVTGTTNETISYEFMIPANTVSSGILEFDYIAIRVTGTNGIITSRIKVSTISGTLGTLISSTNMSGTNYWMKPRRTMVYKSASSSLIIATNSNQTDDSVTMTVNPPTSSINIDWTINQYIQFTLQNASALDTSAIQFASIRQAT